MKRLILFSALILCCTATLVAQNFNRPYPPQFFPYEFVQFQTTYQGYYLTVPSLFGTPVNHPNYKPAQPAILDENGYLAWYWGANSANRVDFKYFPEMNLFGIARYSPSVATYTTLNSNFQLVDSFTNTPDVRPDIHEFIFLSNGNYLVGALKDSIMDLSAYTFNGVPGGNAVPCEGYLIQEFDAAHNLVFQWNSHAYIHPTEGYEAFGYNPNHYDYCHGNSLEEDTDGNLLVSFRHLNSVYKIDHTTGQILWRLGGKSSDFTFANDSGFSGQHDARRLTNGNISVFDNANTSVFPQFSRAVEYQLDTVNGIATRVSEYLYNIPFHARAMGNYQTTPQGNQLINYGLVFRPNPSFVHLDGNDMKVADVFFQDSVIIYRTYIFDLPFSIPRPEISCQPGMGNMILSAPSGFQHYQWSNGDTTQSTVVSQPGIYQVWAGNGNGMFGSFPFSITDPAGNCFTGIPETEVENGLSEIEGLYDLLGRSLQEPEPGQIYLIYYKNGAVQKTCRLP